MADQSYQAAVYHRQDGNELVVASTGTFTQEGTFANSGSMANTGTITNSSDGTVLETVVSEALSATLANYGISSVGSSSGTTSYKLGAPVAGVFKTIIGKTTMGQNDATITSTAATIGTTQDTLVISEVGGSFQLVGLNTTEWRILGQSTGATVS